MSAESSSRGERPKRKKTELACDTCRQRKSRCDGRRPTCSHCEALNLQCVYRPTMTSLEADASVLVRLADIEARLQAIDQSRSDSGSVFSPREPPITTLSRLPELHTAAAHKMVQYWPRLRLKMDIPRLEPLRYLRLADDADDFFQQLQAELNLDHLMPFSPASTAVEHLYENIEQLPFVFQFLINHSYQFAPETISKLMNGQQQNSPDEMSFLDIRQQTLEELLIQTIAFKYLAQNTADPTWQHKANLCFAQALQFMWLIQSRNDTQIIGTRLMFVIIMLYCYGRPFHALGWLKNLELPIMNPVGKSPEEYEVHRQVMIQTNPPRSNRTQELAYKRLYYLLESDLLTEIDGFPSRNVPATPPPALTRSLSIQDSLASPLTQASPRSPPSSDHMQTFLKLRSYLNQILDAVYTMDKAYCAPHDIGTAVNEISRDLGLWYYGLPQDLQFPRSPASFAMAGPMFNSSMDEIMLRYFTCMFLLNRPVLYFLLHENMEQAATPPEKSVIIKQDPWVFESFRVCVQNAIMIILFHQRKFHNPASSYFLSWCDIQLLTAAYSVVLLLQNTPEMDLFLRESGNATELLELTEMILEQSPSSSGNVQNTLEVLRNIRRNFRRHSQTNHASNKSH